MSIEQLITEHLDIWTAADTEKKSGRGRGSANSGNVYGIKKLRELILELAVRGKLVPQDPNDEPASELLKRIQAEKAKLIAEGKIKKDKPLAPITEDEKPFELPVGWEWARLADLTTKITDGTHHTPTYVDSGIPFLSVKDMSSGIIDFSSTRFISLDEHEQLSKRCNPELGDLLLTKVGTTGIPVIVDTPIPFSIFVSVALIKAPWELVNVDYLRLLITSPLVKRQSAEGTEGIGNKNLVLRKIEVFLLIIPPSNEQHRIVAKVDELMALCDQLENQHNNAAEAHEKLVAYLLGTLTQSQNAEDFNANWQRIAEHFDTLFTTETSIDELKQTLLQLAVMGKLVPQDPNDEPASELLKRIQAEKAKLIAEGKIKKDKPLAAISDEEKPFDLPVGWEWVRMGDICRPISSGSTPSAENFKYDDGVPFLKVYNIRNQEIDFSYKMQFIDKMLHDSKLKRSTIYPNDVVMNIVGPPLGKVAIIPDAYPEWNCNQAIVFFGLINPINSYYILNFLKEGSFLKGIELIGTAGQDNISVTKSKNIPVSIPPINEQHRIVAKVDELMAICDQLKTRINEANELQRKIADVVTYASYFYSKSQSNIL